MQADFGMKARRKKLKKKVAKKSGKVGKIKEGYLPGTVSIALEKDDGSLISSCLMCSSSGCCRRPIAWTTLLKSEDRGGSGGRGVRGG